VRVQLLLDLLRDQLSCPAVDGAMHHLDRTPIKDGQLEEVRIRNDAGQRPASRDGHFDLSLKDGFPDLQIGKELPAFEQLCLDLPARRGFDPAEIVPDGRVASMRRHRLEGAAQEQRLVGRGLQAQRGRRHHRHRRGDDLAA
jgi:hypothetical protein